MTTAKIFQHGGSQAVRLPKAFRFSGTEVLIEKREDAVILRPVSSPPSDLRTVGDVSRYFSEQDADAASFPEPPPRPRKHERPIPEW
ncbi:MAG: AbrB/MazE/SpoVT family DNA-binding domain-containing protein [Verrucomicrobia bacterium]|nr:AbrB/MazE/SpoVT family DNA-binding domain-containing protein [Verrucomicrobiota bacterium]